MVRRHPARAVLFLQNNASSVNLAMNLQYQFFEEFKLVGQPNCTGNAGDPFNNGQMILCAFATGGPLMMP